MILWKRSSSEPQSLYGKHAKNLMKTDVKDVNDHYEVAVDLPGFQKDEVNVELEDSYLTISAAKGLDKETRRTTKGHYIRQERYSGSCNPRIYVGDIQPEDIHAKYEDGILKLTLPKADQKAIEHQNRIAIQ